MAISTNLGTTSVEHLWLDPENPRIGRENRQRKLGQPELLKIIARWSLEELVDSFLKGGFWTQEAIVVVREELDGEIRLVVVEGNRRVAALKMMRAALEGDNTVQRAIREKVAESDLTPESGLFERVPYLLADQRSDVDAYLGFRHVTGIKEWRPAEKADFIAQLIEKRGLSYKDVASLIGSRSDIVRQNYIAFSMLRQMEDLLEPDLWSAVEDKFSVLFLSLRSEGVRNYLGIDGRAEPVQARTPVQADKRDNLEQFVLWLFGSKEQEPFVKESRDVDRFGYILAEPAALKYLASTDHPSFDTAYALTKESGEALVEALKEARRQIGLVLGEIDLKLDNKDVIEGVWPVLSGAAQLALITKGENLRRLREAVYGPGVA